MNGKFFHISRRLPPALLFIAAVGTLLLVSCNSARRVPEGKYLLTKNLIVYRSQVKKSKNIIQKSERSLVEQLSIPPDIAPAQVLAYIKQKTNTRILGYIPLHLLIYNMVDSAKAAEDKIIRNQKIDEKYKLINEKRLAENKEPVRDTIINRKKDKRTFREWLMNAGEPPVILDSSLMNKSLVQIGLFLQSKGYFKAKVRDSVAVRKKKAKVFYIIDPGKPYKIDSLKYVSQDSALLPEIYADSANCLINQGDNYNLDNFTRERDRLAHHLNDEGYYEFSSPYIYYDIDSTVGDRRMNVTIGVNKFSMRDTVKSHHDSLITLNHTRFYIRSITIQMQYDPSQPEYHATDTLRTAGFIMVYPKGQIGVKPNKLLNKIFIRKGDIYRVSDVDYTYTALTQLKTFRYIGIRFAKRGKDSLDCFVQLMPVVRQSIGLDAEYDNTGGNPGVQGDVVYQNNNLFKGEELLQIKIRGGLQAQRVLGNQSENITSLSNLIQLNTFDIGPELDFSVPRPLFPFNIPTWLDSIDGHTHWGLWPKANPQTVFKVTLDYQNLPLDYSRQIFGLAYTFNFDPYERKNLNRWHIVLKLPELDYVNANLVTAFKNSLESTNNFFLLNSFTNHFVPDIGGSFTYNDQILTKPKGSNYLKVDLEESGYLLRALWRTYTPILQGNFSRIQFPNFINPDPTRDYSIIGVPYSYYVLADADYRHYFVPNKVSKIVFRVFAGAGIPRAGVTPELPFDKSFWAGGANDMRGWYARGLGPGGYSQPSVIDQIGDIKIVTSGEYRFNVISVLNLALFFDAGNIWLIHPNPAIPNGNFLLNGPDAFYNQYAFDAGLGFRFDFTYFVFRLDLGFPFRDPSRPVGEQWTLTELSLSRMAPQIGIGYPF